MSNQETLYIPLENVESEHCALIVKKGLDEIKEISESHVEVNNRRVKISAKYLDEALPLAVQKIRDLGYGVPTVKKHYPVLNMDCASCASSSQNVLKMQAGVVDARVNYANTAAEIEFIPSITNPEKLKIALQEIGFDLMIDESDEAKEGLEELHKKKYASLKKRTFWAIALSVPLMAIGMIFMNIPYANYIMWALSTPIVFIFGRQFYIGAWKQLKHGSSNMDTLVAMSTGIAYLFSVYNTLFPDFWESRGLEAHVYFEAAGVIIAFILIGKLLEEGAKGNTSSALKKLIGLQPKSVTLIQPNGVQVETSIASIQIGDLILVKPGEKIAVDGEVTSGTSFVDESMISGEPMAVEKKINDQVFAGTINQKGSFQFRATKVGGDTLLSQIIKMVQDAQGSKAPVQNLVDKIASIFVPIVLVIALLTLITWIIFGGESGFTHGLLAMITVLVIACPCALGLATPTAIMVGIGKGAEHGILIKDAESLETAKNIDAVVFDKTGTLTEGKPKVSKMNWFNADAVKYTPILYSIEKQSEHPLADAIVNYLEAYHSEQSVKTLLLRDNIKEGEEDKHLVPPRLNHLFLEGIQIENVSGKGIMGIYEGEKFFIGNPKFIEEQGISLGLEYENWMFDRSTMSKTIILFSDSNRVLAGISVSDELKPTSKAAVQKLHDLGIEVFMLTGDNAASAAVVAREIKLDNYQAEVLPQDKLNFIKELQADGKIVAMAGDGINDSAALAQSNVGIAMGKGSDIAIESAKMTILSNDLLKIPEAIKLSQQTVSTIRQNLFWAFIYNIIGIPIAAGILYPFTGFLLNPMIAGAAMALSSVSVVSNSLRLKWKK
jgi:Cu2+-exporting ATPase